MNHLRVKTLVHVAAIILVATLTGCTWASAPKAWPQTADVHPSAGLETTSPQPVTPESRGEAPVDSQAQSAPDNRASNETATVTNSNNAAEKVKGNGQGRSRGRSSTSDTTPPTIVIGSPTPSDTSSGPVTYLISYNDADSITLRKRDVTLNTTGSALGSITVSQSGAKSRTIAISNITGNGTLAITIAPGTAVDAAGNVAAGAGPSETVEVVNPAPTLTIGEPSDTVTNTGPVSFKISYANADTISLSDQDITLSSQEGVTGSVNVAGSGTAERTVTVDNLTGIGTFSISVAAGTAENVDGETSAGAGPSASVDVYGPQPTLEPGPGFDGPTPQPDAIGTGPGSDAKAIARWDVVPYQTFDGIFQIGVVAFHINGIDRVEFSLEGGPWTAAMPFMIKNPRTGVMEYWVNLDANLLNDAPCEVRAVVYPIVGIPRVLGGAVDTTNRYTSDLTVEKTNWLTGEQALLLIANAGGRYAPHEIYVSPSGSDDTGDGTIGNPYSTVEFSVASLKQAGHLDNGHVYLMEGEYDAIGLQALGFDTNADMNTWLTISAAPGLSRDQVIVRGLNTNSNAELLRFEKITFISPAGSQFTWFTGGLGTYSRYLWLDDCAVVGEVRSNSVQLVNGIQAVFLTDVNYGNNKGGLSGTHFMRNVHIEHIGGDSFSGSRLVLNCSVRDVDPIASENPLAHADVYQIYDPYLELENMILYGLTATEHMESQGFFGGPARDCAVVNTAISQLPGNYHCFSINRASNLYVKDSVFDGASYFAEPEAEPRYHNVVLEGSRFGFQDPYLPDYWDQPGITIIDSP